MTNSQLLYPPGSVARECGRHTQNSGQSGPSFSLGRYFSTSLVHKLVLMKHQSTSCIHQYAKHSNHPSEITFFLMMCHHSLVTSNKVYVAVLQASLEVNNYTTPEHEFRLFPKSCYIVISLPFTSTTRLSTTTAKFTHTAMHLTWVRAQAGVPILMGYIYFFSCAVLTK